MRVFDRLVIGLNNLSVKGRRARAARAQVMVLLPACLQAADCKQDVAGDVANCRRCGRCKIGPLLDLCDRLGVAADIVKGGRAAVQLARQENIKALVAVACEKELRSGIIACLPKPVIAVVNKRPNGPCNETDVAIEEVGEAIKRLTKAPG